MPIPVRPFILAAALATAVLPVTTRAADPPKSTAGPVFPYPIRKSVLENGLTILSVPFDSPGIVAYYTLVRAGSRNEVEKGLSGFAHFFEHMMFRGTDLYPEDKYNDVLKTLGADSNAYTNVDCTTYHMTIPATALAKAVEIEADRFQNLKYDEPSFQKEARAVLGEYNKSASSPFLKLFETLHNEAFTTHTYKHTTIGFLADIKEMPNQYAYSRVFFDRWYRPENCTIIVTGDVQHEVLLALAKQHYGAWKPGKASVNVPSEPPQAGPKTSKLTWPLETLPTFVLGYHIPAADPGNSDSAALRALEQSVFSETSPLYKDLVLKEQKAASLWADAEPKRDPGLFIVITQVRKPEDLTDVTGRIRAALAEAARKPIERARLDAIKAHLRYQFVGSLQSADDVADALSAAIATTGRPESINEIYDAYDRLTPADLARVAARYFESKNETMITLETEAKK
jgi:zinc protease